MFQISDCDLNAHKNGSINLHHDQPGTLQVKETENYPSTSEEKHTTKELEEKHMFDTSDSDNEVSVLKCLKTSTF